MSPLDSVSQVSRSSRRSSGTSRSSRTSRTSRSSQSSRAARSATVRAEQKAKIAAVWVQLESEQHLAELRVQKAQADVTRANETKKAELRAVLETSLAKDGALEPGEEECGEGDDEHEHESSHDQRLKRHYVFPDVGEIAVTDGAGAYQVHCGLGEGNFKVIDKPASSSQSTSSPEEGAQGESSGLGVPQERDHRAARPKVLRGEADAPPESTRSEPEEGRTTGSRTSQGPPEATSRARHPISPGGQDDTREAPQVSESEALGRARTSSVRAPRESQYQETPLRAPPLEPPRRERDVVATEPLETTRGRPRDRQDRGNETPGNRHPLSASAAEGGPVRDVEPTNRGDTMQGQSMPPESTMKHLRDSRTRSRSRTSRRDSPAAPRVGFLDAAVAGCPRTSEHLQGTTPFGSSGKDTRAPSKITSGNPREWSTIGERVAATPAGPQLRELSPIGPVGLQTPADRPACMQPTPVRPLYQIAEGEAAFRTPGHPPVPQGSEHSPSTEPMGRYSRVTRLEGENDRTVPTPRARIDEALEETQHPEPTGRDGRSRIHWIQAPPRTWPLAQQSGLEFPVDVDGGPSQNAIPSAIPALGHLAGS